LQVIVRVCRDMKAISGEYDKWGIWKDIVLNVEDYKDLRIKIKRLRNQLNGKLQRLGINQITEDA